MEKIKNSYWLGEVPVNDDFGFEITTTFIDGRRKGGSWAIMTPEVHQHLGVGLGIGKGQMYEKQQDGKWLKITKN